MGAMTSQIISRMIVYSIVYSGADQRKYQSSALLAFVREFAGDRWIPRTKVSNAENGCFYVFTIQICWTVLPSNRLDVGLFHPTRHVVYKKWLFIFQ